jgi:hypothetical protein
MSKRDLAREVLLHNPACNKLLLSKALHVARSLLYYKSKMTVKDTEIQVQLESLHQELGTDIDELFGVWEYALNEQEDS